MTNHYYTNDPQSAHDYREWAFELRGHVLKFTTDSGVFSRDRVDYGSVVLLEHFETVLLPEGPILDVGCGYGPIGLTLAKETGRLVEMVDVNDRALELAQRNARINGIDKVEIYHSHAYESVKEHDFAAIVTNPPIRAGKKVVHEILSESYQYLTTGGTLTCVIQKKQGAPSAMKKLEEVFGNVGVVAKDKGYYILRSIKEA